MLKGRDGLVWGEEDGEMVLDEEEGEMVWGEEKIDEDDQEEYQQTLLTAKGSNARRILQVKVHQSCLKSG